MTEIEILQKALVDGMLDLPAILKQVEMKEREKYLEMHESKIYESCGSWFTYLPDQKGRRLVKRKSREAIEDLVVEYYRDKYIDPYIKEVFESWVEQKLKYGEIKQNTADRYRNDYDKYICNSIIDKKIKLVTENELEDFIKSTIHDYKLTSKSWGNVRTLIYGIFKHAKKQGYTNISITSFMGDISISRKAFAHKKKKDEEQVFTDDEVNLICDRILNGKYGAGGLGIILAFYTGLRAGELSALEWSDIKGDFIQVSKTEVRHKDKETKKVVYEVRDFPKTEAGIRSVVLTDEAKYVLELLKNDDRYVFVTNGKRLHAHVFTNKLRRLCIKIGITPRSLHKCRKTYASKLVNANVSESIIKNQLGHTTIDTTRKYYVFNNSTNSQMIDAVRNALKV